MLCSETRVGYQQSYKSILVVAVLIRREVTFVSEITNKTESTGKLQGHPSQQQQSRSQLRADTLENVMNMLLSATEDDAVITDQQSEA